MTQQKQVIIDTLNRIRALVNQLQDEIEQL